MMEEQITQTELQNFLKKIDTLPESQLQDLYRTLSEYELIKEKEGAEKDFLYFVRKVWPNLYMGRIIRGWLMRLSGWLTVR